MPPITYPSSCPMICLTLYHAANYALVLCLSCLEGTVISSHGYLVNLGTGRALSASMNITVFHSHLSIHPFAPPHPTKRPTLQPIIRGGLDPSMSITSGRLFQVDVLEKSLIISSSFPLEQRPWHQDAGPTYYIVCCMGCLRRTGNLHLCPYAGVKVGQFATRQSALLVPIMSNGSLSTSELLGGRWPLSYKLHT